MNQLLDRDRKHAPSFTDKQGQYLAFIWAYTQINRRPPAEADMQRHFEVTAPSVHQMVITLERLGLIQRRSALARSIELLIPPEVLPILRAPQPVKSSVQRY
jgi:DNA-binding MarR family transcriptional regulator